MRLRTLSRPAVLFLSALSLTAAAAHAQRPALVQNIDEKGRVPFHQTLTLGAGDAPICDNCAITFKAVPTGYRLVVTYLAVQYVCAAPAHSSSYAYFGTPDNGTLNFLVLPTPTQDAFNFCVISAPVTFYVESGVASSLILHNVATNSTGSASLEGYLVKQD